jgi:hypothetical protein
VDGLDGLRRGEPAEAALGQDVSHCRTLRQQTRRR